MKLKFFTIPISSVEDIEKEVNAFLSTPRWRELLARATFVLPYLFSIKKDFFFFEKLPKKM